MKKYFAMMLCLCILALPNLARAEDNQDSSQIAKQIIALQLGDEARKKASETVILMITPLVVRDNPGQEDKIHNIMEQTVAPVMASSVDDMARQAAEFYVQSFTPDELKQLLAFVGSPLGEKYRKFNVDMAPKLKDIAKATSPAKTQEAMRTLVAQLKLNGLKAPKEIDH